MTTTLQTFSATRSAYGWLQLSFPSSNYYFNACGLEVRLNPYNSNWVEFYDNWQGRMVTVDYTKASAPSPAGKTREQWIDAVVNLLT